MQVTIKDAMRDHQVHHLQLQEEEEEKEEERILLTF